MHSVLVAEIIGHFIDACSENDLPFACGQFAS